MASLVRFVSNALKKLFENYLFPILEKNDGDDLWFQHGNAICHITSGAIDPLRSVFEKI